MLHLSISLMSIFYIIFACLLILLYIVFCLKLIISIWRYHELEYLNDFNITPSSTQDEKKEETCKQHSSDKYKHIVMEFRITCNQVTEIHDLPKEKQNKKVQQIYNECKCIYQEYTEKTTDTECFEKMEYILGLLNQLEEVTRNN